MAQPSLELVPTSVRPGDLVRVWVRGADSKIQGELLGKPLEFFPYREGHLAISALPVETEPGEVELGVRLSDGTRLVETLNVRAAGFNERTLTVSSKFVAPPKKAKAWIAADRAAFKKAFAQKSVAWHFSDGFELPRKSVVTAPFGDLRLFNGKKQSQHFGTDLDGKVGEPVTAAQAGKVVLARACYTAGNAVVVHHGGSLYTSYFHLSSFAVKKGDHVKKGQVLGALGKTGRVTGPHLHWGVKVDGRWADAESLLRLQLD